eukprot:9490327-Pyramimonas_sp.AAC.2
MGIYRIHRPITVPQWEYPRCEAPRPRLSMRRLARSLARLLANSRTACNRVMVISATHAVPDNLCRQREMRLSQVRQDPRFTRLIGPSQDFTRASCV